MPISILLHKPWCYLVAVIAVLKGLDKNLTSGFHLYFSDFQCLASFHLQLTLRLQSLITIAFRYVAATLSPPLLWSCPLALRPFPLTCDPLLCWSLSFQGPLAPYLVVFCTELYERESLCVLFSQIPYANSSEEMGVKVKMWIIFVFGKLFCFVTCCFFPMAYSPKMEIIYFLTLLSRTPP